MKKKGYKKKAPAAARREAKKGVRRELSCHETLESATWAYRCGVYWDVRNKTDQVLKIHGITAGSRGGPRQAVLFACAKSSKGRELDKSAWVEVWSGTLREKTSTDVPCDVGVPPFAARGFLLHSDTYAVYHSAEGASDENIELVPGRRSRERQTLSPFEPDSLSEDLGTHAGSVKYSLAAMDLAGAFETALTQGRAPLMRAKLSVVGEGRSGKTSTVKALLGLDFDVEEPSTVGAKTSACEIDRTEACDFVRVDKDTKADYALHRKDAAVRVLANNASDIVASTTAPPSAREEGGEEPREAEKQKFVEQARAEAQEVARKISSVEIAAEVAELGDEENETFSSKDNNNNRKLQLTVWDYGGQRVFYDLHHLFLTRQAFYLVVFDMRRMPEATSFILFWLRSLRLHAEGAPIALVGTHKDVVPEGHHQRIHEHIVSTLSTAAGRLVAPVLHNDSLCFFPVENTIGLRDPVHRKLKETIRETILAESYVAEQIPVRWLKLVDILEEDARNRPFVSLEDAANIARTEAGLDDVEVALAKFHQLGALNWWSESDELRSHVVLDPQWLVDSISLIIRDYELHGLPNNYKSKWVRKLKEQAVLSDSLCDELLLLAGAATTEETRRFLKHLMIRMSVMCPFPTKGEHPCYLVPSLLIPSKPARAEELLPWSKAQTFVVSFKKFFLPTGLFERFVCLMLRHASDHHPIVNATDAWLAVQGVDFHALNDELGQEIRCEVFLQVLDRTTANRRALTFVRDTLAHLRNHFAKNLKYTILVPSDDGEEYRNVEDDDDKDLARFAHWFGNSASPAAVVDVDALFAAGRAYARRVMEPDIKTYQKVWDRVRRLDPKTLIELGEVTARLAAAGTGNRAELRQPSFGETSTLVDNDVYFEKLYDACEAAMAGFYGRVESVVERIEGIAFHAAPSLKKQSRSLEKVRLKYDGDVSRLRDVLRCKCVAENVAAIVRFLRALEEHNLDIASLKLKLADSFDAASVSGGYRDLNLNILLPEHNFILAELQIHLKDFDDAQAALRAQQSHDGLSGHDRYVIYRRVNERLGFQKKRIQES
ncbi:hypothetical protein CTAYLR_003463 [Chrysophaeum taylorii]|uniref:non-specific serine/threonine protein kinase n=1 Tax=Chrysophaeum taylorii TaxID=2483200 RepID=A0AAD7XL65_9STRA|nr:hypothetical protein CTAYLR_003463 [Chrysophaeum taylorii]